MMKIQSRKIWYYRITLIILWLSMMVEWARLPCVLTFLNPTVTSFATVDEQGSEGFLRLWGNGGRFSCFFW
ncbi:hypothetical protein KCA24_29870, partial [Escherichia coli]|nr:hypothetical protein [Escherichia coli]